MTFQDIWNEFKNTSGITNLSGDGNMNRFYTWLYYHPDYVDIVKQHFDLAGAGGFYKGFVDKSNYLDMLTGKVDPLTYAGENSAVGSSQAEKVNDNLISIANTEDARRWEEFMAQNSLLFNAEQLQKLGLSSSGVLQTGAASHSGVGAADNVKTNLTMQKYQEKMSLAKSILGMTGQMARAGIMGGALARSRVAAATLTSAASHSALNALKNLDKRSTISSVDGNGETFSNEDLAGLGYSAPSGW